MILKRFAFCLAMVLSTIAFWPWSHINACISGAAKPVFIRMRAPDSIAKYISGELGLLQPSFPRVYLFIAWRQLNAIPFSEAEQKSLLAFFNAAPWPARSAAAGDSADPLEQWRMARARVPGIEADLPNLKYQNSPVIRSERIIDRFFWYPNCLDDAFKTAARTLDERILRYGASNAAVRDWVLGQDKVFANCTGGPDLWGKQSYVPSPAPANAPSWLRADRAYQTAAAAFYAGSFEQAKIGFRQVASDRNSPWRPLAALLSARSLIRQATTAVESDAPDMDRLKQAEQELETLLNDKSLEPVYPSARRLLEYIRLRRQPSGHLVALAESIQQPSGPETLAGRMRDLTFLLDKCKTAGRLGDTSLDEFRSRAEMLDWIFTFQDRSTSSLDHAVQRWNSGRKNAWLVAVLSKLPGSDPRTGDFLAKSAGIAPGSPGYYTVVFHRIRLMAQSGSRDQACRELDRISSSGKPSQAIPPSADNAFRALRFKLAGSMEELLAAAPRKTVAYSYEYHPIEDFNTNKLASAFYLDEDAAAIFTSRLPLSIMDQAARHPGLPVNIRRDIAIAAWTRAVMLGVEKATLSLSPLLAELEPALKKDLDNYISAASPAERRFGAALLLVRAPGMRPIVPSGFGRISWDLSQEGIMSMDFMRDNWWCQLQAAERDAAGQPQDNWRHANSPVPEFSPSLRMLYPDGRASTPAFLPSEMVYEARRQWEQLCNVPAAPVFLGRLILDFARAQPNDPRVPEALHRVVRSTRLGCVGPETSEYSRRAFTLLHKRYPNTEWAKATKYWY